MSSFQIIPQMCILQQIEKPISTQNTSFLLCPTHFFFFEDIIYIFKNFVLFELANTVL